MAAVQKLLINLLVTTAAVAGREAYRSDYEAVVIFLVLPGRRLVTIQAIHAFLRVPAHFVFVDDRVLSARMTLGAFSRGPHQFAAGLPTFGLRAGAVDEKRRHDQAKRNDNRDEDGAK